jgi:hypothetical protein
VIARLVSVHPVLAFFALLALLSAIVFVAFLVGLLVFEVEWRIRSRRARRRGSQVDLTGARF